MVGRNSRTSKRDDCVRRIVVLGGFGETWNVEVRSGSGAGGHVCHTQFADRVCRGRRALVIDVDRGSRCAAGVMRQQVRQNTCRRGAE